MNLLKQKWMQIMVIGIILFVLVDATLRFTDNVNYFPTVMILGAFLVPVAFVAYFYQQDTLFIKLPDRGSILPTVLVAAIFGGLIGTTCAGVLEYTTLSSSNTSNLAWVGPIEEFAKLVVPICIYVIMRKRFRTELDGLLIGVAAGMAFAALETMGYELVSLVSSNGNLNVLDETILIRGLLSPAGHAAWTGLITATLWKERQRTGKAITPIVFAYFLLVATLHSLWDYASSSKSLYVVVPAYVALSSVSLGLLIWRFREARSKPALEAVTNQ
jgi:protease PrsW